MSFFVLDVESDGPVPGIHSMVCFGAVRIDDNIKTTFYGKTSPISDIFIKDALAISGFSREEHQKFDSPNITMKKFVEWVNSVNKGSRPIFLSDNIAYDWQWINYYTHVFAGSNPFGYSGRRIADIICGLEKDLRFRWKDKRKTKHDHNPVNDAIGNAEAFLYFLNKHGIKY